MAYNYKDYEESDAVKSAATALSQHQASKPADYTNQYSTQLSGIMDQLNNRKFSYDVNNDALYQQYKQQYMQNGKKAMQDTMGQAAGLTGGYGSSYAQSVGQQQYNAYLQDLNSVVPELYQQALSKYQMEGDELTNRYSMMNAAENQDYSRWQDQQTAYNNQLDRLQTNYNNERSYDRSNYETDRSFQYGMYSDRMSVAQTELNWYLSNGITPPEQLVQESGYSQEYVNAYLQKMAADAAAAAAYVPEESYSGGGNGGGTNTNTGTTTPVKDTVKTNSGLKTLTGSASSASSSSSSWANKAISSASISGAIQNLTSKKKN